MFQQTTNILRYLAMCLSIHVLIFLANTDLAVELNPCLFYQLVGGKPCLLGRSFIKDRGGVSARDGRDRRCGLSQDVSILDKFGR